MTTSFGIYIPTYWHNDNTNTNAELILNRDPIRSELDIRNVLFYTIDSVVPHYDDEGEYCSIYSGSTLFSSPYTVKQVEKMINKIRFVVQNN